MTNRLSAKYCYCTFRLAEREAESVPSIHPAHCCLTPHSSGAPTAGHQARSGGTRYIFASPGRASCRRRPLSSNVRPHPHNLFSPMRAAQVVSVVFLFALGLLGGCLVVAGDGFTTSGKRGQWQIFVPPPQSYVMAAIMFALSAIALLWLLRQAKARSSTVAIAGLASVGAALFITRIIRAAFA